MANFVTLDNQLHSSLRVQPIYADTFGDNVNQVLVFPTEFQALQKEYPIFFRKKSEGGFFAVVVLGLSSDENLFLKNDRWDARYVPAIREKGPFALSIPDTARTEAGNADPIVKIDLEDSRVGDTDGHSIFLPQGGFSPYFENQLKVLQRLHIGASIADQFFEYLESFNLIEPMTLQLKLNDETQVTVPDLYSVSRQRMLALSGDELHQLNGLGLLEHCYAVMSSTDNMANLVDMKVELGGTVD